MSRLVYPRISDGVALERLGELRAIVSSGGLLHEAIAVEHSQASPVPTGGPVASPAKVVLVRDRVADALARHVSGVEITSSNREFDWELGRALHEELDILASDAAHRPTWSFLSLMVFPDVVWTRFPDPPEERALGGPRNVLRRAWRRYDLLRSIEDEGADQLNEDELVQLTERTALARNPSLVHALARAVIGYDGLRRMDFTRELCKRAVFQTGPVMLDALGDEELSVLIEGLVRDVEMPTRDRRNRVD